MNFRKLLKYRIVYQISLKQTLKKNLLTNFSMSFSNRMILRYSRCTRRRAVFVDRFNRTLRNSMKKKSDFEKRFADWIGEIPSVTKKHNKTFHHSAKKTPVDT